MKCNITKCPINSALVRMKRMFLNESRAFFRGAIVGADRGGRRTNNLVGSSLSFNVVSVLRETNRLY
jgi:hypothetical protein